MIYISQSEEESESSKSIPLRGKREVAGMKGRSSRPSSGRHPPTFQQKVELMYKDEEESSDEGEGKLASVSPHLT